MVRIYRRGNGKTHSKCIILHTSIKNYKILGIFEKQNQLKQCFFCTWFNVNKLLFFIFQRFNVTLTRAKALLIVIGNPHTLSLDEHWRRYVLYQYTCLLTLPPSLSFFSFSIFWKMAQNLAFVQSDLHWRQGKSFI